MNLPEEKDLVDRAVEALRATEGADVLPEAVLDAARRNISQRVATRQSSRSDSRPRDRVSWLALAACVALMVIGSWTVGFQKSLFSRATLQQKYPNGSVLTHYTDGRVVAIANRSIPPSQ